VGLGGDELVLLDLPGSLPSPRNQGDAPVAFVDLGDSGRTRTVLASGPEAVALFERAVRDWKLLMAGAQIGLAAGALAQAIDFAVNRVAFGVPITNFQAVSHPMVDVAMQITGARRLLWKAAWFCDHEPEVSPELVPMAYLAACEAGMMAPTVGTHVQGGFGFTLESDMHLFFKRAKGWTLVAGDPRRELDAIATAVLGPAAH
jgi:alkylation response protein AidB-like acyl-CoA dehydrogenase